MIVHVLAVSRNKSIAVGTLHMLLNLSGYAYTKEHRLEIHFVESLSALPRFLKTAERILWVDYGRSLDVESFPRIFDARQEVLVFPSVTGEVDWGMFKSKIKANTAEHRDQAGLVFDTTVDKKVSDGLWSVSQTNPSIFLMDCKAVEKKFAKKSIKPPREMHTLFEKFRDAGVKVFAWTPSRVTIMHTYECIGNIMNVPSVTWTSDT